MSKTKVENTRSTNNYSGEECGVQRINEKMAEYERKSRANTAPSQTKTSECILHQRHVAKRAKKTTISL